MELFQLEQFAAIAEARTMREAAASVGVSQSALSQNLRKLEDELGFELFDRSRNRLSITSFGEEMLAHARHILDGIEDMRAAADDERRRRANLIRIGSFSTVFAYFELPQIAHGLPDHRLACTVVEDGLLHGGLIRGDYDCAVTTDGRTHAGIAVERIVEERALVSVPARSKLARCKSVSLANLSEAELLLVDGMPGLSEWYRELAEAAGAVRAVTLPADDYLREMESTRACHFSTTYMERYMAQRTSRIQIPLTDEIASRGVYLAYREADARMVGPVLDAVRVASRSGSGGAAFLPFIMGGMAGPNFSVSAPPHGW